MPPHRLFLQAAEAAKLAADAGLKANAAVARGGESASVAWFLFLLALIAMTILAVLHWKELKNKTADIQKASAVVREECAREMALSVGHDAALFAQSRTQFEQEIARLRDDNKEKDRQLIDTNKELRQQELKTSQVLEATSASLRVIAKTSLANNANTTELLRGLSLVYPQASIRPGLNPDIL